MQALHRPLSYQQPHPWAKTVNPLSWDSFPLPLYLPLPGKTIKQLFSTSPQTLSGRFDSVLVHTCWSFSFCSRICHLSICYFDIRAEGDWTEGDWEVTKSVPACPPSICLKTEVIHLCPTLCDPMDCGLPGSSVHGIFQARVLQWVAISFSRGSSQPRDQTQVYHIAGRWFTIWATREALFA